MSARLTSRELSNKMLDYLCTIYPYEHVSKGHWCMDIRMYDDPAIAFYPDTENKFRSCEMAMEYLLEEGLPVWFVQGGTNFPMEVMTYKKLEMLFDL